MPMKKLLKTTVALVCLAGVTAMIPTLASAGDDQPAAPGVMIKVGDAQRHLQCAGQGPTTVILEAGLGGSSLDWVRVFPEIAKMTRVCAYDRAGYGWSELGALPRTGLRIALELKQLLDAAGEQGPFVVAGHSYGGFAARLFAAKYPDVTRGVVLVDASHERQFRALRKAGLTRSQPGSHPSFTGLAIPDNMPEPQHAMAVSLSRNTDAELTLMSEMRFFQLTAEQAEWLSYESAMPVTILTRGKAVWGTDDEVQLGMETTWQMLQQDLYERIGSRHVIVEGAGHYIHLDKPQAVVDAIADMLKQVSG